MTYLSPFQTLPIHIAEAISYYCIGLQRHRRRDIIGERNKEERVWLVLHDVSSSWMQLARRNLNKSVVLRLSDYPDDDEFTTMLHSRRVIEQSTAIVPRVKTIDIYLDDIIEELNEEDIEKLGRVWPEDLVFPKARSLNCYLKPKYGELPDSAKAVKYFSWFMERVRSSLPNLQETEFILGRKGMISISPSVLFSKEWDTNLFLLVLFRIGSWNMGSMQNEITLLNNAPELTSVCYHTGFDPMFASWLIKKSAATLEKFHYSGNSGGGFKIFLFSDDGQVILYPRLWDLHVFDPIDYKGELTTDKSTVPFPVLQHLRMHSRCIFKDDTFFRGSSDTLISLDIGLHRGFVDVFRKYKVFPQGAYPNLFHISATHVIRDGLTLQAEEFVEAAFGLVSPATQSIKLVGDIPYQHIASAIPTCPYLENIRIVHLKIKLSLLEILDMFKHFPHMTDFGCRFRGLDSELDSIQDELIPSHLGTQYSQLTSLLKCWHIYPIEGGPYNDMAILFVTLAILCPNFTFVKELAVNRGAYKSRIEHVLSSGLYDQHAKRLGRLFES